MVFAVIIIVAIAIIFGRDVAQGILGCLGLAFGLVCFLLMMAYFSVVYPQQVSAVLWGSAGVATLWGGSCVLSRVSKQTKKNTVERETRRWALALKIALDNKDAAACRDACHHLGELKGIPTALPMLKVALNDADIAVRLCGIAGLSAGYGDSLNGYDESCKLVFGCLGRRQEPSAVRAAAARAIGQGQYIAYLPQRIPYLQDTDPNVRLAMCQSFEELIPRWDDKQAFVPALLNRLDRTVETSQDVRTVATRVLGEIGAPESMQALQGIAADANEDCAMRAAASQAIGKIKAKAAGLKQQ